MESNVHKMREALERIDMKLVSINCVDSVQKRSIDNCRILIKQAISAFTKTAENVNSETAIDTGVNKDEKGGNDGK